MKTPVNGGSSVAFTAAISVGVVLGIVMTFIILVSLIVVLRRRRYLTHL